MIRVNHCIKKFFYSLKIKIDQSDKYSIDLNHDLSKLDKFFEQFLIAFNKLLAIIFVR